MTTPFCYTQRRRGGDVMELETVIALLSVSLGSGGVAAIVLAMLQRKWTKDDRVDALVAAQKVLMVDRVRFISRAHIAQGEISLEDKETINEMFSAYKALGGNGHLDTVMGEVEKLKVVE